MKCYDCGGDFIEKNGILNLENDIIGNYEINNVQYYKCNQCKELAFPESTMEAIEKKEAEKKDQLIKQLPISEFIGATEAAKILGISRQAIHKHRRIRRGFIYFLKFQGRIVYHKKSVELFKETGDGRFPLVNQTPPLTKYIVIADTQTQKEYIEHKNLLEDHRWNTPRSIIKTTKYAIY